MKLVKFENGTYGIRLNWCFGWYFKDLQGSYSWRNKHRYFKDCQGTEQEARKMLSNIKSKYTVVKDQHRSK